MARQNIDNGDSGLSARNKINENFVELYTVNDALVFKGVIDCSANPNYPAADAGDTYKVSVAGKIGGGSGPNVEIGDLLLCTVDGTISGTHAAVGANWTIQQVNIDGAVTGPASSTDGGLALFNSTSGKIIKSDGLTPSNDDILQRKSGVWTNRTLAELRTDLISALNWLGLDDLPQTTQYTVLGRIASGTGNYENLTPGDLQDMVFNFSNDVLLFAHFTGSTTEGGFTSVNSGTGSSVSVTSVSDPGGKPGIATCNTGTTTTGYAYERTISTAIRLSFGILTIEGSIRIPTLSDGTDTFTVVFGLHDNPGAAAQDGVYFRYTHGENSGRWRCITANNSAETITDLDVTYAVVANTWYKLNITVNAAGTSVDFSIDDVLVATHTANIPTGVGRVTGFAFGIAKSAGTTNRTSDMDYAILRYKLT